MKDHEGNTIQENYKSWKRACKRYVPRGHENWKAWIAGGPDQASYIVTHNETTLELGEWDGTKGVQFDRSIARINQILTETTIAI